jgi:transposase
MLAALVRGERDPQVLAELAKGKLPKKLPQLRRALRGRFREHHGLLVGLALAHQGHLEGAIAALDGRSDEVIAPFAAARDRLDTITGSASAPPRSSAPTCGVDMTVFPTAGHLASWAGRCPGNNLTGASVARASPPRATAGWPMSVPSAPGPRPEAATPTWPPSCWRLWPAASASRKAAIAVGHSILVIAWYLLDGDCDDHELGSDLLHPP